jgi:hypothetical protein
MGDVKREVNPHSDNRHVVRELDVPDGAEVRILLFHAIERGSTPSVPPMNASPKPAPSRDAGALGRGSRLGPPY